MFSLTEVSPERNWRRAQTREMSLVIGLYSLVLVPTLAVQDRLNGPLAYVVSALPIIPYSALGWVVARSLRRVDERERALGYRAIAFAFFATAVATFSYGFLENAGAPKLSMFVVWPVMAGFWVAGRWAAPRMP